MDDLLVRGEGARLAQHRVDQGGLAVVDVGDDRYVPPLRHDGHGRGFRFVPGTLCAPRVTSAVLASGAMTERLTDEPEDGDQAA